MRISAVNGSNATRTTIRFFRADRRRSYWSHQKSSARRTRDRSPQYQITASKLAQAFQSVNMQESMLVQRMRARESQAVRQQISLVDPSDGQDRELADELNSVELPEQVNIDAPTFDRF